MNTKYILKVIIIWRLLLLVVASLAILLLPFKDSFPYRDSVLVPFGHPLFYSWANFDGVHYLGIAKNGYFADFTQAFFPLYPLLIRWVDLFLNHYLLSGLLVSHLALILFAYVFLELAQLDVSRGQARRALLLIFLFPTSFYLGSVYTESLFLFLVVASFYFMRTKQPVKAIVAASFASATRIIGIFLIPALIIERYTQLKTQKQRINLPQLAPYIIPSVGLLTYMRFLQIHYSDAFYFLHAQPAFGSDRSVDRIILLYQVIFRYLKMLVTVQPGTFLFYTVNQEFLLSLAFLVLLYFIYKRFRLSYAVFSLLAYLIPTLTGTFSSMPRYLLVIFPAFLFLATVKHPLVKTIWLILSVILLIINTILFTRGYWIA